MEITELINMANEHKEKCRENIFENCKVLIANKVNYEEKGKILVEIEKNINNYYQIDNALFLFENYGNDQEMLEKEVNIKCS